MKLQDGIVLLALGLVIWVGGTIYYAHSGPILLETSVARYWRIFAISPVTSTLMCVLILRWRRIDPAHWTSAMLLLAIPGMVGEAIVLTHLPTFMPKLHAVSGGKYGALLFATYAVALGTAEVVTLRAAR
jgi:cytochrome bd-type quinol oxidase subunit 2